MAVKNKDPRRNQINQFLVQHKIGQFCVQVRYDKRRNHFRAFLCTHWRGGNILQFQFGAGCIYLDIISTRNDREEYIDAELIPYLNECLSEEDARILAAM